MKTILSLTLCPGSQRSASQPQSIFQKRLLFRRDDAVLQNLKLDSKSTFNELPIFGLFSSICCEISEKGPIFRHSDNEPASCQQIFLAAHDIYGFISLLGGVFCVNHTYAPSFAIIWNALELPLRLSETLALFLYCSAPSASERTNPRPSWQSSYHCMAKPAMDWIVAPH